jgi:hypothetical protein
MTMLSCIWGTHFLYSVCRIRYMLAFGSDWQRAPLIDNTIVGTYQLSHHIFVEQHVKRCSFSLFYMRWSVRTSSQVMSVYQWKSACWDKPDWTRSHRIPLLKKINKREYIDIKMIPNNTIINYLHVILRFLLRSVRFPFLATTYSRERWTAAFS